MLQNVSLVEHDEFSRVWPHWTELLHAVYGHPIFGTHRLLGVRVLFTMVYAIFAILGTLCNIFVVCILVFMRHRTLNNITNLFVLTLAISDILLCGFNMPMQAYFELYERAFSGVTCKIMNSIFALPMHVSCLTMLLIAFDRYLIIIYPHRARMSRKAAVVLILLVTLISVLVSIPIILYTQSSNAIWPIISADRNSKPSSVRDYSYCIEQWPNPNTRLTYSVLTFLLQFFFPLVLTLSLYGRIFVRLNLRRLKQNALERTKRTNHILIRIVACFVMCWTPWTCFSLWLETQAYRTHHWISTGPVEKAGMNVHMLIFELIAAVNSSHTLHDQKNESVLAGDTRLPKFGVQSAENMTKLIDIFLKLLAMSSGCINPWLYGWLNKLFCSSKGRQWRRLFAPTVARHHDKGSPLQITPTFLAAPTKHMDEMTHLVPPVKKSKTKCLMLRGK